MSQEHEVAVTRNDEDERYEIRRDGVLAGFTVAIPDDQGRVVFPHTEIDPAFSGEGLGSILIKGALEDAASRGDTIVPECSFVKKYLHENAVDGLSVHWRNPEDGPGAATAGTPEG